MKAWTDYPFTNLGDIAGEMAPIRPIKVISYDRNKYCKIEVCGIFEEIKCGYIYARPGRLGTVRRIKKRALSVLGKLQRSGY